MCNGFVKKIRYENIKPFIIRSLIKILNTSMLENRNLTLIMYRVQQSWFELTSHHVIRYRLN